MDIHKGPGLEVCYLGSWSLGSSYVLSRPLHIIFNKSLSLGYFPDYWKLSFLTPIYKNSNRADVSNYRPVCRLSIIPKLFENIITKFLTSKLDFTIMPQQFGSIAELNLLTYEGYLSAIVDGGGKVHSIYTDVSKAFDRVYHNMLLNKLKIAGMGGTLLQWIGSYLTNRTQMVNIRRSTFRSASGLTFGTTIVQLIYKWYPNML